MTEFKFASTAIRSKGFSLIEVLIAVVVVSVGLLALASLQARLARASADSKAQTVALALAQERIEDLRSFGDRGGYGTIDTETATTLTPTGAGTSFSRTVNVSRLVWDATAASGAGAFVAAASNTGTPATREFKELTVQVGWTGADGQTRQVTLRDIVSAVTPGDGAFTLNDNSRNKRTPQVRIYTPDDVGIIPIAIGNDRSSASSNPKPELSRRGSTTLTQFNVQTYLADISNGDPLLQRRVDFAGINCECRLDGTSTNASPAFEPTYWDGRRYVVPKRVPESAQDTRSRPKGRSVTDLTNQERFEENLCNTCCRDHHDAVDSAVKVDPYRPSSDIASGNHNHYVRGFTVNPTTSVVSPPAIADNTTTYHEVCRLVRVDGIFRVSTDSRMENMTVLNMEDTGTGPIIPQATIESYAAFAKAFVEKAWEVFDANSDAQPFPAPDALLQTCTNNNDPSTCTGTTLGQAYENLLDINEDARVTLGVASNNRANLNGRGLYIDYLSDEAIEALGCIGNTVLRKCREFANKEVLEIVPFIAVNLTGLADWGSNPSGIISVSNEGINAAGYSRGAVSSQTVGQADGFSEAFGGNASLVNRGPTDPDDLARKLRDDEQYTVETSASTPSPETFVVDVNPDNLSGFDEEQIGLRVSAMNPNTNPVVTLASCVPGTGNDRDEQTCTYSPSAESVTLTFSNYNVGNCNACSGGGWTYDSATNVCRKGANGVCTTIGVTDFKLCSVAGLPNTISATLAPNGAATIGETTTAALNTNGAGPLTLSERGLAGLLLTATFAAQASTCP